MITHKREFDLAKPKIVSHIFAGQGEGNTRSLEAKLFENGTAWTPPSNASIAVAFKKPDGTRGVYDMLPNGDQAITATGNTVTAIFAPQVLTCPGEVAAALIFVDQQNGNKLMSFPFCIMVAEDPSAGADVSNNYFYFTSFDAINKAIGDMSELETDAKTSLVAAINEAFGGGAKGITSAEKKCILFLLKSAAYASEDSANMAAVNAKLTELEALWSVSYKVSYSLTGATASNDATAVVEGAAYTTTLTAEGGYTLTGATVKITMGGKDITSTAYKGGVITIESVTGNVVITVAAREIPSFTITNNLTNVTNSNSATKVTEGDFYSANLSWESAYSLNTIVITMGGVDVTADVYGEGNILITEVTGDVVITAEAGLPAAIYMLNAPLVLSGTPTDTGIALFAEKSPKDKAFAICFDLTTTNNSAYIPIIKASKLEFSYNGWNWRLGWYSGGGAPTNGKGETATGNLTNFKMIAMKESGTTGLTLYSNSFADIQTISPTDNSGIIKTNTGTVIIDPSEESSYAGTFNDFRIYERALTESEIKAYFGEV